MKFRRSIWIDRPPVVVFRFLRDKDTHVREPGSPVVLLRRETPGPVRVGTSFLEVVRIVPRVFLHIRSEMTRVQPHSNLEERFRSRRMVGYLAYEFRPVRGGTLLVQKETLRYRGLLALCKPLIERMLIPRIEGRLQDIRDVLEAESAPRSDSS